MYKDTISFVKYKNKSLENNKPIPILSLTGTQLNCSKKQAWAQRKNRILVSP